MKEVEIIYMKPKPGEKIVVKYLLPTAGDWKEFEDYRMRVAEVMDHVETRRKILQNQKEMEESIFQNSEKQDEEKQN